LGKPESTSCTEDGLWESIAKFLWLLMSPRRSTPSRSRKAAAVGEVRFLGDVENSPLPTERTIRRLADRYDRLQVCFETGPMGYGLYRFVLMRSPERFGIKAGGTTIQSWPSGSTWRRDAVTLARLLRPSDLTPNRPFAGSETDWRRRRYSNGP
jgi:hypothetical protein